MKKIWNKLMETKIEDINSSILDEKFRDIFLQLKTLYPLNNGIYCEYKQKVPMINKRYIRIDCSFDKPLFDGYFGISNDLVNDIIKHLNERYNLEEFNIDSIKTLL